MENIFDKRHGNNPTHERKRTQIGTEIKFHSKWGRNILMPKPKNNA